MDKLEHKLCYVKNGKCFFTSNYKKQWGDDWNDRPYEHNAGEPYDTWSELLEDKEDIFKRKWKEHKIDLVTCYVEFPFLYSVLEPYERQGCLADECNSKYSVEDINKSIKTKSPIPWLMNDKFSILPGTTFKDFINIVKEHQGKIYVDIDVTDTKDV